MTASNVGVNPDTFTVTWNPPAQQNGVIVSYEVQYKVSSDLSFISIFTSSRNTSINLPSLITDVEYIIQVRAINAAGPGNFTNQLTVFNSRLVIVRHDINIFDQAMITCNGGRNFTGLNAQLSIDRECIIVMVIVTDV